MDAKKQAGFVKAMGKNRKKFAKGGLIRKVAGRKYFVDGGTVLGGPGATNVSENATNPNSGLMGSINQALGLNDNFQASAANIQQGTNAAQLNDAYTGVQGSLNDQGFLVGQLQPQVPTAISNQNAVAAQELAMTQGKGPNPALMQLNKTTGTNVANTTAEMAGQRGASQNPGLIAREAAQQGAATQQDAAGQAATLEAQQQIAAQGALTGLANNQISQTGQAVTGENSAQQNEQAILQNANTSANNAEVGMQSNINNVNAQTAAANQNMAANTFGGITSALSSASSLFAKGGEVGKDDHLMLAEMMAHGLRHCRNLKGIVKNFDEGGEADEPNLGKFSAGDDTASAPNIGSTAALPADQTNLASAVNKPSSITGGGGGGGGGGLSMLAALANGGIVANPLISNQPQAAGPGNWAAGYFNAGSSSNGPNIGSTASLPANTANFSKDVGKGQQQKPDSSKTATGQAAPWEIGGGMAGGPDDTMDNSGGSSPGAEMAGDGPTMNAAKGGMARFCPGPHKSHVANFLASGGAVPAMVSPGEIYLSPDKVEKVIREGANPLKIGMKIPGKAKIKGDSLKNDTVPMDLEDGGVVIDREHVMSPDKAELFVHRALARKKARK